VDVNIISLKINLFTSWYSWNIAELALNNNHSLTLSCPPLYCYCLLLLLCINQVPEVLYCFQWVTVYKKNLSSQCNFTAHGLLNNDSSWKSLFTKNEGISKFYDSQRQLIAWIVFIYRKYYSSGVADNCVNWYITSTKNKTTRKISKINTIIMLNIRGVWVFNRTFNIMSVILWVLVLLVVIVKVMVS
jgi:hypothetical protein